jgi:hypothetical protein
MRVRVSSKPFKFALCFHQLSQEPKMATQIQTVTSISTCTDPVENLSFRELPPFPDDIPTAPLHRLSLSALRKTDTESEALFAASKNLGFFYLDLRDDDLGNALIQESDQVFGIGPDIFDLGRDKLAEYDHAAKGSIMGYKGYGAQVADEKGNLDRNEFFNVSGFLIILPRKEVHVLTLVAALRYPRTISWEYHKNHFPNQTLSIRERIS